jgi:hypothetical protein
MGRGPIKLNRAGPNGLGASRWRARGPLLAVSMRWDMALPKGPSPSPGTPSRRASRVAHWHISASPTVRSEDTGRLAGHATTRPSGSWPERRECELTCGLLSWRARIISTGSELEGKGRPARSNQQHCEDLKPPACQDTAEVGKKPPPPAPAARICDWLSQTWCRSECQDYTVF